MVRLSEVRSSESTKTINVSLPEHVINMEMAVAYVNSQFNRRPDLIYLSNDTQQRDNYLRLCVPLHKAALKGDWKEARHILWNNQNLVRAAITKRWATALHVAAKANQVHFVEELVKMMRTEDLELLDWNWNTAFCYAAATGNMQIVEIMLKSNESLPTIRCAEGITPLHMAAIHGISEMAWYLYPKTLHIFEHSDWLILFFNCIYTGIYDLALNLLEKKPDLAFERQKETNETVLHILARKPLGSICQSHQYRKRPKKSCLKQTQQLQLVRSLWKIFLTQDENENIRVPSPITFNAVEVGNFEFLLELISTYPDLIWDLDDRNRSIIHIAVLHRYADIFNLIHDICPSIITTFLDEGENNLLHMAAKLAPTDRLELVSGEAFQMTLELLWFEEVKKIMLPSFIEMKNAEGLTHRELFTREHQGLLSKAESWMKGTTNSCMVISTLIAAGVVSVAFSLQNGINDTKGSPSNLQKTMFLIFFIFVATALISSSTSIFIFLSIIISRYAEDDFYKSLPLKLIFGMVGLFISMASMMIALSSAFFFTYYHGLKLVSNFVSVLAFVPIPLFAFMLLPHCFHIVYSTYFCWNLFRPRKHILH